MSLWIFKCIETILISKFEIVVCTLIVVCMCLRVAWLFSVAFGVLVTWEQLSVRLNSSLTDSYSMQSKVRDLAGRSTGPLFLRLTDSVIWTCGIGFLSGIDTANTKRSIATEMILLRVLTRLLPSLFFAMNYKLRMSVFFSLFVLTAGRWSNQNRNFYNVVGFVWSLREPLSELLPFIFSIKSFNGIHK